MKKYLLYIGMSLVVVGTALSISAEAATSIAIYSNGFAVVRQEMTPEAADGGVLVVRGLPRQILPHSVMLEGTAEAPPLNITEQWVDRDEAREAALHWRISGASEGTAPAVVYFTTGGFHWEADYNLVVDREQKQLDLTGWATLRNDCGMAVEPQSVTLVYAGEPKAEAHPAPQRQTVCTSASCPLPSRAPAELPPALQIPAGSPAFPLQGGVVLVEGDTKQVKLAEARNVAYEPFYLYQGGSRPENHSPYAPMPSRHSVEYNQSSPDTVMLWAQVPAEALRAPLPPGRVQVYERNPNALLRHTARLGLQEDGPVEMELGVAEGLRAKREQKHFTQDGPSQQMRETMEVTLSNDTDTEVQVRVQEQVNRGKQWEITEASNIYQKTGDDSIEFRVQVPAAGSVTVSYTVAYSRSGSYW